jgi:tetratricopeptide (TPR) repeat protein
VKFKIILLFITILSLEKSHAQTFLMTEKCLSAYQSFMSMKVSEGKNLLIQELKTNPKNILPLVLINYEDFISLVFNENPSEYKKRKTLKDKRLAVLEQADKNSPFYLFSKALLYFQWSMIQIKYNDYWDAAWDFRKAFQLFKENKKKYPSFVYNNIYIGASETVISTIPNGYKWISNILGLKGNMKSGLTLLNSSINNKDQAFKEEAYLYTIYLKNYVENDIEGANQIITNYKLDTKNNQLFCFMAANIALNNKKAALTESYILNRTKSNAYIPFPMLEYELGDAKLRRLDYSAIQNFQNYLSTSKSNFYLKDACLNIAYCYYLQDNLTQANQYKNKIKSIGKTESDADKQAQRFAETGIFPDKDLLKARLLNDGGYNDQALKILLSKKIDSYKKENEKLEYIYRLARTYDDLNQDEKALEYYKLTIDMGSHSPEYFAARAALQAGYIFEKKGQKNDALIYFNKVLDMDDHAFKNSLDQRAKSGINRVK